MALLSLSDEQVAATKRTRTVIPAGTYAGQDKDVVTTSLDVVAFATTAMDDETAYQMTKTFWEQKEKMSADAPWWKGVTTDMLASIPGKIHPGAQRYYAEKGVALTDAQK